MRIAAGSRRRCRRLDISDRPERRYRAIARRYLPLTGRGVERDLQIILDFRDVITARQAGRAVGHPTIGASVERLAIQNKDVPLILDLAVIEGRNAHLRTHAFDDRDPFQTPTIAEPALVSASNLRLAAGIVVEAELRFQAAERRYIDRVFVAKAARARHVRQLYTGGNWCLVRDRLIFFKGAAPAAAARAAEPSGIVSSPSGCRSDRSSGLSTCSSAGPS